MISHTETILLSHGSALNVYRHTDCEEDSITFCTNSPGYTTSTRFSANLKQAKEVYEAIGACLGLVP